MVHVCDRSNLVTLQGGERGNVWWRPALERFEGENGVRFKDGELEEVHIHHGLYFFFLMRRGWAGVGWTSCISRPSTEMSTQAGGRFLAVPMPHLTFLRGTVESRGGAGKVPHTKRLFVCRSNATTPSPPPPRSKFP